MKKIPTTLPDLFSFVRRGLIYRSHKLLDPILLPLYRRTIPRKVAAMRRTEHIRVAFVVPELGVWKTERLFEAMLKHPRFCPQIMVVPATEVPKSADAVLQYVQKKGYPYIDLRQRRQSISKAADPHIVFYQKPYDYSLPNRYNFRQIPGALFCFATYGFHTVRLSEVQETPLTEACWQVYFENELTMIESEAVQHRHIGNNVVTGLPMGDDLSRPLSSYPNPWKEMNDGKRRKRIIWAPHHSVAVEGKTDIDYSTFLQYADFMLDMARKTSDTVQWAFKPHPLLRANLEKCWKKEQIDNYYHLWATLPNTQLELGSYQGLFMHSDAMIHDCSSFIVEYMFTKNPVLYLVKNDLHRHTLNSFALQAFLLHEHAEESSKIAHFIDDIVAGHDAMKEEREKYYNEQLMPPGDKTACENIIAAILGE